LILFLLILLVRIQVSPHETSESSSCVRVREHIYKPFNDRYGYH